MSSNMDVDNLDGVSSFDTCTKGGCKCAMRHVSEEELEAILFMEGVTFTDLSPHDKVRTYMKHFGGELLDQGMEELIMPYNPTALMRVVYKELPSTSTDDMIDGLMVIFKVGRWDWEQRLELVMRSVAPRFYRTKLVNLVHWLYLMQTTTAEKVSFMLYFLQLLQSNCATIVKLHPKGTKPGYWRSFIPLIMGAIMHQDKEMQFYEVVHCLEKFVPDHKDKLFILSNSKRSYREFNHHATHGIWRPGMDKDLLMIVPLQIIREPVIYSQIPRKKLRYDFVIHEDDDEGIIDITNDTLPSADP